LFVRSIGAVYTCEFPYKSAYESTYDLLNIRFPYDTNQRLFKIGHNLNFREANFFLLIGLNTPNCTRFNFSGDIIFSFRRIGSNALDRTRNRMRNRIACIC
jgi:hypothetical protein